MTHQSQWSKDIYEQSVSSRCWWPYDPGWNGDDHHGVNISKDDEVRNIVRMETELEAIPDWARQLVETSIRMLPPCGHYMFPMAYIECVDAIGSKTPPEFTHGCFTVDPCQKKAMQDYCLCLDGWLAGAAPEAVALELNALGHRKIDWHEVCTNIWNVLGEHTELKDLLVERLLHSQRWKIKSRPWDNDPCTEFGRDAYLGDFSETGCEANSCTYIARELPGFNERSSPRIQKLEFRLADICDDWDWFSYTIQYGWLCSPKAFRYLERLIWSIGKERRAIHTAHTGGRFQTLEGGDEVPGFLECEDTYLNQDEAALWWRDFLPSLEDWWQGRDPSGAVAPDIASRLGESTNVKRWLVRLLLHKCRLLVLEKNRFLWRLVNPAPNTKRGSKPLLAGPEG